MSSKKSSTPKEPQGYAEALSELEAILSEIDNPKVDVDVLSDRVARASFLIAWCKERIDAAQFSVNEIVASLGDHDDDDDLDDEEDEDYDEDDDFDDEDDED
jgi:exodeoxyribonuclease VII small subunit